MMGIASLHPSYEAAVHSARTASSPSVPSASKAVAANSSAPSNCDSAQAAAPRTSGLASSSRRLASPANAPSFELPIAISTLRMKRSRPMRLTGDLVNCARNAVSSSRASSTSSGARNASRAASLVSRPACANLFQGQTARQSSQP